MAQDFIMDAVEADAVINLVKQQLRPIYQNRIYVVEETLRLLQFTPFQVFKINGLLATVGVQPVLSLTIKICRLRRCLCRTEVHYLFKLAMTLIHHDNGRRARPVLFFAYKHAAKVRKNCLRHPASPVKSSETPLKPWVPSCGAE